MNWAYFKENDRWTSANNDERITVRRNFTYGRLCVGFGLVANVALYFTFFVGIYDFRATELINMRRVPLLAKIGVSTFLAY